MGAPALVSPDALEMGVDSRAHAEGPPGCSMCVEDTQGPIFLGYPQPLHQSPGHSSPQVRPVLAVLPFTATSVLLPGESPAGPACHMNPRRGRERHSRLHTSLLAAEPCHAGGLEWTLSLLWPRAWVDVGVEGPVLHS